MNDRSGSSHRDSLVDAAAILSLIVLAVATAIFWVGHQ